MSSSCSHLRYTLLTHGTRSLYEQGIGLAAGLRGRGARCSISGLPAWLTVGRRGLRGSTCIGIGSWSSLPRIYDEPRALGGMVVPWLVSDDTVTADAARRLDALEWFYVTSRWCRETFAAAGVRPERMRVLPGGIDTAFWSPSDAPALDTPGRWLLPLWRSRRINGGGLKRIRSLAARLADRSLVRLLSIGEDVTSKGFQEVLEGLARIGLSDWIAVAKIQDTPCSRRNVAEEMALAHRLGLHDRVVYVIGRYRRPFIRDLVRWSSLYAAPSRHEGFGLPHVQALGCGRPVLTCRGTAAEETSVDGVTGFVVPSMPLMWTNAAGRSLRGVRANPEAVGAALSALIGDAALRNRLGAAGRRHVIEHFDSLAIAGRVIADTATLTRRGQASS